MSIDVVLIEIAAGENRNAPGAEKSGRDDRAMARLCVRLTGGTLPSGRV